MCALVVSGRPVSMRPDSAPMMILNRGPYTNRTPGAVDFVPTENQDDTDR
jgi:hypothetical protein